jgi:two-component system alkaline phosphatase synthesis response regulator PhoP
MMAKILVVDDDQDIRELISFTLRHNGFDVFVCSNGMDAVRLCAEELPNLVIMDVRLPGISGYEACRQITTSEKTKHIPVIFLSAKGQLDEIRTGLEAGAVEYYLKPFTPQELVDKVNQNLACYE